MKVLKIDYGHYLYPEYGSDLDSRICEDRIWEC